MRFQLSERRILDLTLAIGAAVQRMIMEQHDPAVGGRRNIDLDHRRAKTVGHLQTGQRVLEVIVHRHLDPGRGAVFVAEPLMAELLRGAPMREQVDIALGRLSKPARIDEGHDEERHRERQCGALHPFHACKIPRAC